MDKAKQVISDFTSRSGQEHTSVDQDYRKAVTDEHVRPSRHENINTVIDKEVHQDHHHTTIQPIKHSETLPEKHTHNAIPVAHKSYEHDNTDSTRSALEADAAAFTDKTTTHDTTHTSSKAPVVAGQHVHHHMHEHIQPVIQKETIQPEVVHTTVPIHETHHAQTVHHGTHTNPVKTMEEFEQGHGTLQGRGVTTIGEREGGTDQLFDKRSGYKQADTATTPTTKPQAGTEQVFDRDPNYKHVDTANKADAGYGSGAVPRSAATTAAQTAAQTAARNSTGTTSSTTGATSNTTDATSTTSSQPTKIPLKDKLNPFKDADGDGKKGIMS